MYGWARRFAVFAVVVAQWTILPGLAAADRPGETVILFGGLSYLDEQSTPRMAAFLQNDAAGHELREGDALLDFADVALAELNASGALPGISRGRIIATPDAAWELVGGRSADALGKSLTELLHEQFGALYGLVLVASYEDTFVQNVPYNDPATRGRILAQKRTHLAGIDALLIEIADDGPARIVLSASSMIQTPLPPRGVDLDTPEINGVDLRKTYEKAIRAALTNLRRASAKGVRDKSAPAAMVTGFAISDPDAAQRFGYDFSRKPTAAGLNANMCAVPVACPDADGRCNRLGALLVQGLTSSLSRAGVRVLPPLNSGYAGDMGQGVELKLRLSSGNTSLFGAQRRVVVRATDAAVKYVPTLRLAGRSGPEPNASYPAQMSDVVYHTVVGYVSAPTGLDGCAATAPIRPEPQTLALGCAVETYVNTQGPPPPDAEPAIFGLALADNFDALTVQLSGKSPIERGCRRVGSTGGGQRR